MPMDPIQEVLGMSSRHILASFSLLPILRCSANWNPCCSPLAGGVEVALTLEAAQAALAAPGAARFAFIDTALPGLDRV